MADVQASFPRDVDAAVTGYNVFFTLNGGPQLTLVVPRTPLGDAAGYNALYSSLTPAPAALVDGDVVGCPGVESVDSYGQSSPLIGANPPSITVSIAPPPPPPPPTGPASVTLAQV